jgi:hypothetical protein
MSIGIAVVSPVSREHFGFIPLQFSELISRIVGGSVVINSTDPFAPPLIDPGYFSNEWDFLAMRDGIGLAERFVSAPAWSGYVGAMTPNLANLSSADLETAIRNTAAPNLHMVGTAGMSARGARYGVVDPDLQVKGAVGLSVIDASVVVRLLVLGLVSRVDSGSITAHCAHCAYAGGYICVCGARCGLAEAKMGAVIISSRLDSRVRFFSGRVKYFI